MAIVLDTGVIIRDFDKNAVECVRKWKFEPATKDGKPVSTRIAVEVSFHVQ